MGKKAYFRANRELMGLSQADVAEDLGVSIQSVKRWEREDMENYSIPERATEYIDEKRRSFITAVVHVYNHFFDLIEDMGSSPDSVQLTYFRDQRMYDDFGRDPGRYSEVNAISRAVASMIEADGIRVEWSYPSDDDKIPTPYNDGTFRDTDGNAYTLD